MDQVHHSDMIFFSNVSHMNSITVLCVALKGSGSKGNPHPLYSEYRSFSAPCSPSEDLGLLKLVCGSWTNEEQPKH